MDLLGGPVAKTVSSQYRGSGFDPCSGKQIPYAATKNVHASAKRSNAVTRTQLSQKKKKRQRLMKLTVVPLCTCSVFVPPRSCLAQPVCMLSDLLIQSGLSRAWLSPGG